MNKLSPQAPWFTLPAILGMLYQLTHLQTPQAYSAVYFAIYIATPICYLQGHNIVSSNILQ